MPETFDVENNDCWYLGRTVPMKVFYDFGCTDEAFVFDTWVFTDKLTAYSVENSDASVILLSKGDDVYKLAVNPSGDYVFYPGWIGIRGKVSVSERRTRSRSRGRSMPMPTRIWDLQPGSAFPGPG